MLGDASAFEDNLAGLQVDIVTLYHSKFWLNMITDIADEYGYLPCG